jgi:RecA-family ATPase
VSWSRPPRRRAAGGEDELLESLQRAVAELLAGPPKVGKSWLSLGLGLAVAAGGQAFDSMPVQGGPVLYLALEDTPRRLQTRMGKLLGGQPAPAGSPW